MRNLSFLNRSLFIINIACAAALLLSYAAKYVSPAQFWPLAFFGLGYPFILAANIVFIIYWLVQKKKQALLSIVVILIGLPSLNASYGLNFSAPAPKETGKSFKILSYNVRVFDLYNWTKNTETRNKIFRLFTKEQPDILCIQEFFHSEEEGYFTTLDSLRNLLSTDYEHIQYTTTRRTTDHWGIATFSAYPIVNRGKISFPGGGNNICIYSDIKINEDTVRVYNAHLASVGFRESDYRFIDDFGKNNNNSDEIKSSKSIFELLKNAFIRRAKQAEIISENISQSPYPVIICGDFNDTPVSYGYKKISSGLTDAFTESGSGIGYTYAGRFPPFRIDYILHSKNLESFNFKVIKEKLSDHYPVACEMVVSE